MSMVLGTALVRIQPSMAGFGASLSAGLSAQGAVMQRAGAAASLLISAPIIAGVAYGVKQAISFETAFAGVKKTVNATDEQFGVLEKGIVDMANKMPFAREEIAAVVEAAGRFGVATDNLLSFSEVALKLGAATNLGAGQAAEQLTRLANIMHLPATQFENLGSSLVALGNDFPTTEGEIVKFTQRLAGAASVVGASSADILGLAAGMASLGVRSEAGGSAMSRVFLTMHSAVLTGGADLKGFSDVAGTTADEFAAKWKSDPTEAVLLFIKGIQRLNTEGANTPQILKDMHLGEIRVRDMLLRSASGYDTMTGALMTARAGFDQNNALQKEYAKRLATTASQWTIFKNNVSSAALAIGQALLPALNQGLVIMKPVVAIIQALAAGFAALPGPAQATIGVILLMVVAIGPLALIIPRITTAFGLMSDGLAIFMGSMSTLIAANPAFFFFLLAAAIVAAVAIIVINWDTVGPAVDNALRASGVYVNQFIDGPLANLVEGWMALPALALFAWGGVVSAMQWAWEQIKALCVLIKNAVSDALGPVGKAVSWAGGAFSHGFQSLSHFDTGGTVMGRRGVPQLAVVHGGETVLPTHKRPISDYVATQEAPGGGNMTVNGPLVSMSGITIRDDRDITLLARDLRREMEQAAKAKGVTYSGVKV